MEILLFVVNALLLGTWARLECALIEITREK